MTTLMKRNGNGYAPATTFGGIVDQFFQDNLGHFFDDNFWGFNDDVNRRQVPVNIRDNVNAWQVDVIAPGFSKEDFKLQVANGLLTVAAEHREEKQEGRENDGWLRREYRQEAFSRSFSLDDTVDSDHVEAKYHNGILQLALPKKPESRQASKPIQVQ